jgi:hypothetical protein
VTVSHRRRNTITGNGCRAYIGRRDRLEQAVARAGVHLERFLDVDRPDPAELVKARAAIDDAIELLAPFEREPIVAR